MRRIACAGVCLAALSGCGQGTVDRSQPGTEALPAVTTPVAEPQEPPAAEPPEEPEPAEPAVDYS